MKHNTKRKIQQIFLTTLVVLFGMQQSAVVVLAAPNPNASELYVITPNVQAGEQVSFYIGNKGADKTAMDPLSYSFISVHMDTDEDSEYDGPTIDEEIFTSTNLHPNNDYIFNVDIPANALSGTYYVVFGYPAPHNERKIALFTVTENQSGPTPINVFTKDNDKNGHLDEITITTGGPVSETLLITDFSIDGYKIVDVIVSESIVRLSLEESTEYDTGVTPLVTFENAVLGFPAGTTYTPQDKANPIVIPGSPNHMPHISSDGKYYTGIGLRLSESFDPGSIQVTNEPEINGFLTIQDGFTALDWIETLYLKTPNNPNITLYISWETNPSNPQFPYYRAFTGFNDYEKTFPMISILKEGLVADSSGNPLLPSSYGYPDAVTGDKIDISFDKDSYFTNETVHFTTAYFDLETEAFIVRTLKTANVELYQVTEDPLPFKLVKSFLSAKNMQGEYDLNISDLTSGTYGIGVTKADNTILTSSEGQPIFTFTIEENKLINVKFTSKKILTAPMGKTVTVTVDGYYSKASTTPVAPSSPDEYMFYGTTLTDNENGEFVLINRTLNPVNPEISQINIHESVEAPGSYTIYAKPTDATDNTDSMTLRVTPEIVYGQITYTGTPYHIADTLKLTTAYSFIDDETAFTPLTLDTVQVKLYKKDVEGYIDLDIAVITNNLDGYYTISLTEPTFTTGTYAARIIDIETGSPITSSTENIDGYVEFTIVDKTTETDPDNEEETQPTGNGGNGNGGGESGGGGGAPIINHSPKAVIKLLTASPFVVGQKITVDGTASTDPDNNPIFYSWNFGDGTITELSTLDAIRDYQYTASGIYTITLKVQDSNQASNSTSTVVSVIALPDDSTAPTTPTVPAVPTTPTAPTTPATPTVPVTPTTPIIPIDVFNPDQVEDTIETVENMANETSEQIDPGSETDSAEIAQADEDEEHIPAWLKWLFGSSVTVAAVWTGILANRYRKYIA